MIKVTTTLFPGRINYFSKKNVSQKNKVEIGSTLADFKSIYDKNSFDFLAFKGIKLYTGFNSTLDDNWFQLGTYQKKDGSIAHFQADAVQIECAKKIYDGSSLVYSAPTGSGKTAVANYAITKNLNEGKKTIYTSPLKALANDKYREFSALYGKENVGILTGDIKFNTTAPIQIMTTEVYKNQVSAGNKLNDVGTVIFDEAHYLADDDRGNVWENSIMNTPDNVQILCLSATIGNVNDLVGWMASLSSNPTECVELTPENRYVPLNYYLYSERKGFREIQNGVIDISQINPDNLSDKQLRAMKVLSKEEDPKNTAIQLLQNLQLDDGEENSPEFDKKEFEEILSIIYKELTPYDAKIIAGLLEDVNQKTVKEIDQHPKAANYPKLVGDLKENSMLPAIIFNLSKEECKRTATALQKEGVSLTSEEEKAQIKEIISKYISQGMYFGDNYNQTMLLNGYAYHHAGLLPQYRKLVEELFSKKLLKCVAATSTLSAGINMPARTTVITGVNYLKYDAKAQDLVPVNITASEFHQMTGRAGRRGIDELGNVVFYNLKNKRTDSEGLNELQRAYKLLQTEPENLRSQFKPDFQTLAQYWDTHANDDELNELIKTSFRLYLSKDKEKQFKASKDAFKRAQDVLIKQGYLEKSYDNSIKITPKGKILKMSEGMNPLILSGLIYDEKLKDLTPEELCAMVGFVSGSDEKEESSLMPDFVLERLKGFLMNEQGSNELIADYKKMQADCLKYEQKYLKAQKEARLKPEDIKTLSSFAGFVTYIFAYFNNSEFPDSISNFKKLTRKQPQVLESNFDFESFVKEYNRKAEEGNVYKILAQVITTLKQIERICEFAIDNPELYPNQSYYKELKQNAFEAQKLVKLPPMYDELSL